MGEGTAEGFVEQGGIGGVDVDDVGVVFDHTVEGFDPGGFGFGVGDVGEAKPGAVIDLMLVGEGLGIGVAPAATQLRGEIVGVGVEVALGAAIGGSIFHRIKPGVDVGVLVTQGVAFVVVKTGMDPF